MCYDADTAYLHQFDVYLGWQQNSFGLRCDVVMEVCKDILGKIIMSVVTTCLHLSSFWRIYWPAKHIAVGQYEWIRGIFQMVFVNLVEWCGVLKDHTRMAIQTWWPLFGKTIYSKTFQYKFRPKKCSDRQEAWL